MEATAGRILLVLAHPDDESFVGGGTLAHYARKGCETALLTFTDGQAGRPGLTGRTPLAERERLGDLRREEMRRAAEVLGIGELFQPGWRDGELDRILEETGAAYVAQVLREFRPHVLISFGPEGGGNGHRDHIATCRWSEAAFDAAAKPNSRLLPDTGDGDLEPHAVDKYYWITWPRGVDRFRGISSAPTTTVVELGEDITQRKIRAFREHRSQHDHLEMYTQYQEEMAHQEYFHLAKSRVNSEESAGDLFAGIDL